MKRYEVVTPVGYVVAVPKRIWKAWPSGYRRYVECSLRSYIEERKRERKFNAELYSRARFIRPGFCDSCRKKRPPVSRGPWPLLEARGCHGSSIGAATVKPILSKTLSGNQLQLLNSEPRQPRDLLPSRLPLAVTELAPMTRVVKLF